MILRYRNGGAAISEDRGIATITGMNDFVEMQSALRKYLADKRGYDTLGTTTRKIPRTLNADVLQLAAMWSRAVAGARMDVFGMKAAKRQWQEQAARVVELTTGAPPTAVYADNRGFWDTTNRLAIRLQVAAEEPPDLTFTDALVKSVADLPSTLADAVSYVLGAAGSVASGVGEAAGDVAEGAGRAAARGLGPLFKPLLLGAGLLGGGYLVTRAVQTRRSRRA